MHGLIDEVVVLGHIGIAFNRFLCCYSPQLLVESLELVSSMTSFIASPALSCARGSVGGPAIPVHCAAGSQAAGCSDACRGGAALQDFAGPLRIEAAGQRAVRTRRSGRLPTVDAIERKEAYGSLRLSP